MWQGSPSRDGRASFRRFWLGSVRARPAVTAVLRFDPDVASNPIDGQSGRSEIDGFVPAPGRDQNPVPGRNLAPGPVRELVSGPGREQNPGPGPAEKRSLPVDGIAPR